MFTSARFTLLSALAVSALSIGTPVQAQTKTQTVYVSPNQAESGKPIQVTLTGKTYLCDPQFSRHEAEAEKGVVSLTVMAVNNPVAKCTTGPHDFRTDFQIPALKAGRYEVEARLLGACSYEKPPCMPIVDPVEYGGSLEVKDSADLGIAMRPDKVASDKAFDLFITSKNFTCGNEYSNLYTNVQGHSLYVSFTNRPHPEALCPAILMDYGPTFKVPAMKSGVYQVFAVIMPYCGTTGPCPLALVAPQLAGALTVGDGALPIFAGNDGRGKGRDANGLRSGAGFQNGSLRIDMGQGVIVRWRNGISTVTGQSR